MSLDSKLYRVLNKIGQVVLLSMLWIAFSFPVITAGAATGAAYYCALKNIRRDEGSMLADFWRNFRTDFLQGTLALLLFAAVGLALWTGGNALQSLAGMKQETAIFILLIFTVFIAAWMHFVFAGIARFRTDLGSILKNALALMFLNLPRSLAMAVLLIAVLLGFILLLPRSTGTILFLPGLYALLSSFMIEPVFAKYIEADPTPEEDNT